MQKIRARLRFYFKKSIIDNQGRVNDKTLKIQK